MFYADCAVVADYPSLVANILHYPLRWRTIGNHAATKRLQPLPTTYKASRGLSVTSTFGTEGKLDFKGGGLRGTFTASAPSGGIAPAEAETVEVRDGKLRLGVKVERTDSLADPDWRPVAKESVGVADDGTVEITVPANVSSGFYRLQSKGR